VGTRETVTFAQVLIIDDHPLFCDALAMTLRSTGIVGQVATVNTLQAALDRLRTKQDVDIVFLDLNLPNVTGLDGLVKIRNTVADTPILVVSSMSDNRMINAIQRAGARGFVPKHSGRDGPDLRRQAEQANRLRSFDCRGHGKGACHRNHAQTRRSKPNSSGAAGQ